MNKLIITIFILTVGMISIVACVSSDENVAPTQIAQTIEAKFAATAAIEQALGVALTGTASVPTLTPTITLTPIPTETITPTPPPMATVIREGSPVFTGPAVYYELVVKLAFGDQVEILGKSENAAWLWVKLNDDTQGWIATELVDFPGRITQLTNIGAPPTPDIDFTITIVNNHKGGIRFEIEGFLDRITIKFGETFQITVPLATYTFRYVPNFQAGRSARCEKTFTISYDIYWAPAVNDGCNSFP